MVTLRTEELDEIKEKMEAGKLPPNYLENHYKEEERRVFGENFQRDRQGRPVEDGIGSAAHPTRNSVEAYRLWNVKDPDYALNLARMEKELAAYDAKRARP